MKKLTLAEVKVYMINHLYEQKQQPSEQLIALINNSKTILELAISVEDNWTGMFFILDSLTDDSVENKKQDLELLTTLL